jgi:hypothetical protein
MQLNYPDSIPLLDLTEGGYPSTLFYLVDQCGRRVKVNGTLINLEGEMLWSGRLKPKPV